MLPASVNWVTELIVLEAPPTLSEATPAVPMRRSPAVALAASSPLGSMIDVLMERDEP